MAVERQFLRGTNVERIQQVGSSERAEREGIRIESSVRELRAFLKEYNQDKNEVGKFKK